MYLPAGNERAFSGALEFGKFEPSWLLPPGVASFLCELLHLVSSQIRDAFFMGGTPHAPVGSSVEWRRAVAGQDSATRPGSKGS